VNRGFTSRLLAIVSGVAIAASVCLSLPSHAATVDTGTIRRGVQRTYMGSNADNVYDVRFRSAPLREVLQFLSWLSGINIVIPEGIEGIVNVDFYDITVGDALNSVIKANDLDYTVEGNVIRVASEGDFKDTGENLKTETFRLRFATANKITENVKALLSSSGSVIADSRTNSIVVRELPGNIDNVRRFVSDIDIRDAQVLIESKILEATRQFSRSLGVQWGINRSTGLVKPVGSTDVGTGDSGRPFNVNLGALNPTSAFGLLVGTFAGTDVDVLINAAEERGDLYIVSDPSIVTSNGQPARIRSGTTLLIKTVGDISIGATGGTGTTAGAAGSGLQEIDTGVELKVTPQISVGQYVKLDIEATTSQPDFSRAVEGIPVILENIANTTVLVKDGETTVIGGLSRLNDNLSRRKVPFFSKIPILGNLFKNKNRLRENSELMVFITPRIVHSEGTLPVQARVREVEERQESMLLKPILKTDKQIAEEKAKNAERMRVKQEKRKGNKYVR